MTMTMIVVALTRNLRMRRSEKQTTRFKEFELECTFGIIAGHSRARWR